MVRVAMGRGGAAVASGGTGAALLKCTRTCWAACWAAWSAACCTSSCILARADGSGCECIAVVGWELVAGIVSRCRSVVARGYRGRGCRDDGWQWGRGRRSRGGSTRHSGGHGAEWRKSRSVCQELRDQLRLKTVRRQGVGSAQ